MQLLNLFIHFKAFLINIAYTKNVTAKVFKPFVIGLLICLVFLPLLLLFINYY